MDIDESWGGFEVKDFYTYSTGIPAAIGFFIVLLVLFLFFLLSLFIPRQNAAKTQRDSQNYARFF